MKIVICDDEKDTCAKLEEMLLFYGRERGVRTKTEVFFRGDMMKRYLSEEEKIDVLFLDIALPEVSGVELGSYLRETLENETTCIVYISSRESYAMQLFQNRPFDFLIKPLEKEKIFQVMDRVRKVRGYEMEDFEYCSYGDRIRIPWREILYFQSEGRKVRIVGRKGNHSYYGKLSEAEKKAPRENFVKIHKSFLINLSYVREYSYETVCMVNGDILNISRQNRAAVRKTVMEKEMELFGDE